LNAMHANVADPVVWECEGDVCVRDKSGLKVGCTRLKTVARLEVASPSPAQRARFAIWCAQSVLPVAQCPPWHAWADAFLAGSPEAGTASALWTAEWAAEWAAARAAESVAESAAESAAQAAVRATWVARPIDSAAQAAAWAAARAAESAARAEPPGSIDLVAIARRAMASP
ncbi:MAG TPA: hypothetical protein VFS00_31030, partial [Polyangiaceae bacterium]|nr:hypothetical protein [Polyangiaceae bacterium]